MKWVIFVVLMCGVVAAGFYSAKVEVAVVKDRLRDRIDTILGKLDVQRKQVSLGLTGLKEGIERLRKARLQAQVKGEQIQRRVKPQQERIANVDATLRSLRDHLAANKPTEIAGRTYTVAELQELAAQALDTRKAYAEQLAGLQEAQARLAKVAATLARRQQDAEHRLLRMEGEVAALDCNRAALEAVEQASAAMAEPDVSLTKSLDSLQETVNNLCSDVEVELRVQDQQLAADTTKPLDAIESANPGDTIGEIDKALGK